VWAEVDLGAIGHNAAALADLAAPARLCAVVKAGAYGHGPAPVARAALEGGASWLAVALVEEGADLREAGIGAPVLLLSEPPHAAMPDVAAFGLTPTLYTHAGVEAAAKAVAAADGGSLGVHVKVDTGMHRVGAAPAEAVEVALAVRERPELRLDGLWTHFAVADEPAHPFTAEQGRRFDGVVLRLAAHGLRPPLVHACNSAGTIAHPAARHDLVRCGIALYGVAPSPALEGRADLRPALSLRARVSYVKRVAAGEGISYGLRHRFSGPAVVATVPIGYADGVPWRLGVVGGEVLVRGRRRPIAGSVTMDQITVDCGDDDEVSPGDEVVLLGRQGDHSVDAWEWAARLGTIAYEVLCGIGPRVPKLYV
jgi:alanine racemase